MQFEFNSNVLKLMLLHELMRREAESLHICFTNGTMLHGKPITLPNDEWYLDERIVVRNGETTYRFY